VAYIHELPDWPRLRWSGEALAAPLAAVRHRQGRLIGHMEALGFNLWQGAVLKTLTDDVLKSSEIEGKKLDSEQVRSSIARRLGLDIEALQPAGRNVEGVVEMMLDATRHYSRPLTALRDIKYLVDRRILVRNPGGGRSSSYSLAISRWLRQPCYSS
jgi:Fic family protein